MDNKSTDHMIAKVIYHSRTTISEKNDVFNNLIEIDRSLVCDNLIYYYRIINNDDVTIAFRSIFNHRLEDLSRDKVVSLFQEYGYNGLLKSLCDILKGFHSLNIICGSISDSNIILKSDNKNEKYFYLCDYGMRSSSYNNVNYLSPEELYNKEVGLKVDIWCFGILLYYILSGKYPFESENENETKRNIETMEVPYLRIEFGEILNGLLSKMLEKDASNRISISELDEYINNMNSMVYLKQLKNEEKKEEKEEERKEDSSNENNSLSWIISSITQYASKKAEEIKSKTQGAVNSSAVYCQSEIARRQTQLQADYARRQEEMARKQAEIQAKIQASIQSKIEKIKPYVSNITHI